MRNELYRYIAITALFIMPYSAHADIDITSYITRMSESYQRVNGSMLKEKISGFQTDMQNLSNYNFSDMNIDSFKNQAQGMLQNNNKSFQVGDYMPAGLGGALHSLTSNPALEAAAKKEFVLSKRSGDDVAKKEQLQEKENELMIENVSLLYARGLVRRYMLEQEKPEEVEDLNNINEVQAMFANTVHRANNRWISILQSEASTMAQSAMKQLTSIRTEEEEGADEQKEESSAQQGSDATKDGNIEGKTPNTEDENNKKKSKFQSAAEWTRDQTKKVNDWTDSQKEKAKDFTDRQAEAVRDWINGSEKNDENNPEENDDEEREQTE